jgi:hypothetical protein
MVEYRLYALFGVVVPDSDPDVELEWLLLPLLLPHPLPADSGLILEQDI